MDKGHLQQGDIMSCSAKDYCLQAVRNWTGMYLVYVGSRSADTAADDVCRHLLIWKCE